MAEPDRPSFLSSPPIIPPDPGGGFVREVRVVVPVAANPFRVPGRLPPPQARVVEPVRRKPIVEPTPEYIEAIGDAAGEHLEMTRGRYEAWIHLILAFVLEVLILAAAPMFVLTKLIPLGDIGWGLGLATGIAGALWVFHDRWRCIEAFASRFCSGLANLSMLYVPLVALVYANTRGIAKLTRHRRAHVARDQAARAP